MVELGFTERLRDFLGSRKFLWILTSLFALVVVLYFLFVTFFFNPFEDPLADTAEVVPREADYFLRWKGAGQRFDSFPVPSVWREFEQGPRYGELQDAGLLGEWDQALGVGEAIARLTGVRDQLPLGLDLETDLLQEVVLAGRGLPSLDASFDGMLMLRVSFKIKAGVALLGYDFMRSRLPESLGIEELGSDTYRLPQFGPFGFRDAYLARIRDVVLLASAQEWIERARLLDIQGGEGSLARASVFHDNVQAFLAPGDQPVEAFLRWDPIRPQLGRWPDPSDGGVSLALSTFFNTDLLRYAAGYWKPGARFEGRFSGEIDRSLLTPFQRGWAESTSLSAHTLAEYAGMLPADSFLFAAVAGNPGTVLRELSVVIPADLRQILDESLINTGQYQGIADLLSDVSDGFHSGLFLGLRRNDYPQESGLEVEHDDRPAPLFVAILRPKDLAAYDDLETFFLRNAATMVGAQDAFAVHEVPVGGGEKAIAFESPAIPGTGEILLHRFTVGRQDYVLVCNSFKFLRHVEATAFLSDQDASAARSKLSRRDGFAHAARLLQRGASLFFYYDPAEAQPWVDKFTIEVARMLFSEQRDQLAGAWRPQIETEQRELLFPGLASLNSTQTAQLREAVDAVLAERLEPEWAKRQDGLVAQARRAFLPTRLLGWCALSLELSLRSASLIVTGDLALE